MPRIVEPTDAVELAKMLRHLRFERRKRKAQIAKGRRRRRFPLTHEQREAVFAKTGGRCHICGGTLADQAWQADHVLPYAGGGAHVVDNYLPAHALCNTYRWDHLADEFQWVLKIGVWARHQMESETPLGLSMAERFMRYENARARRRKVHVR